MDHYSFSYENTYMKPLLIGDSEESDIIGAKAIGLATCLYDPKKRAQNHTADFCIKHFQEIADL